MSKWEILVKIEGAQNMESAALAEALNNALDTEADTAYTAEEIENMRGHEFLDWQGGKWRLWAEIH